MFRVSVDSDGVAAIVSVSADYERVDALQNQQIRGVLDVRCFVRVTGGVSYSWNTEKQLRPSTRNF